MQFTGIVNTAAVAPTHGGGRTVDLTPFVGQVLAVSQIPQENSLRVDLEPGDVYTTVRRYFLKASEQINLAGQSGKQLRFRKLTANGQPTALLVSWVPVGSAPTADTDPEA